jgi:uncharacterized membrane protein YfcA
VGSNWQSCLHHCLAFLSALSGAEGQSSPCLYWSTSLAWRPEQRLACRLPSLEGPVLSQAISTLVGILTGFLGVGGGFLIVPALVFTPGLDAKKAIGSSLAIIAVALLIIGGVVGYKNA